MVRLGWVGDDRPGAGGIFGVIYILDKGASFVSLICRNPIFYVHMATFSDDFPLVLGLSLIVMMDHMALVMTF